ncbi:MAG: hypothetical protein SFV21_17730 [Rhodospirillaceae bacterium]|nr:hypothetical protein [Rhodospirillaceae bacterium]
MPYTAPQFAAGVFTDDSPLAAEGYFVDADKIRFVRGRPQTIGGWERATDALLTGVCRAVFSWADAARAPFAAFGTHLRLYAMDGDGVLTDITPVVARGTLTNPFSTISGSAVVTVSHAAHGLTIDQKVTFSGASAVGGLTVTGDYVVAAVVDANSYTITHGAAASSTAGPGGGAVSYAYALAPGQRDGLRGLGYGTGAYGVGAYGTATGAADLFARTWCLDNWGQNLLANPRGQGIFEWAPNTVAPELVTQGNFSAATGWSVGAGWSIGAGVASASASSGALSQPVTLARGAWHLLAFDVVTASAGTVAPAWGSTAIGAATSATGTHRRVFFCGPGGAQTMKFTGAGFTGSIDNVSLAVLTTAHRIETAPGNVTAMFVAPERIVVACGCPDTAGNFDPLRVQWCGQENNQDWTASPVNLAGSYVLSQGTRIVRGLVGRGESVIFTDQGLYAMRYVPDPNVVYRFDPIATGCGLIGPNAVTQVGGVFYWMTPGGEFYVYDGGAARPLQSTVRREVSDHLSWVQQDKVFAFPVSAWGEVWWLYPDRRDGNECSRYVVYSTLENTWSIGRFDRTAWCDAGTIQYPLAADIDGKIWFQEKGFSADGAPRGWSLTSAFFDLGDGDRHMAILGAYPDAEDLQGGYRVTVTTKHSNQQGEFTRVHGPFPCTQATGKIAIRAVGRQAQLQWAGDDAPAFFRLGAFKLDLRETGRRR